MLPDVDPATGLPNRRAKAAGGEGLPARRGGSDPTDASVSAAEAPAAKADSDAAPAAPEGAGPIEGTLPPRARPTRRSEAPPADAAATSDSKPFFLDENQPPRLFGRTATPESAPTSVPETPAPEIPAPETPAPEPEAAPTSPEPEVEPAPAPAAAAPAVTEGAASPDTAAPVTGAGLKKRTPRQAGASRAIPGADGERGVNASRRSPEEVRNLLSGFRAGQQRGRSEAPVSTGAPDEKEPNE